jgi:hypothetical protein
MTVQGLIEASMNHLAHLGPGQTANAAELATGLGFLNRMLATWSADRLFVYSVGSQVYSLVIGTPNYLIGPGQTFNAARPVFIERAVVVSSSIRRPVDVIFEDEWSEIKTRTDTSIFPKKLFNDAAFPYSTLNLWPVPSATASLELFTWTVLAAFASTADTVAFPSGYERALIDNLAVEMGPTLRRPVTPELLGMAIASKAVIKELNARRLPAVEGK